jgi:mono/diheme cytochrome c family protein
VQRAAYDKFLTNASAGASENPGLAAFTTAGCGSCHTFTPAGTDAQVGPSLDSIKPAGGKPLEEFIHESIVDPNEVLASGYQPDVMPNTFDKTLSDEQLDALVQYLVDGQKGSK